MNRSVNRNDIYREHHLPFAARMPGEDARQTMVRYFAWGGRDVEEDAHLFRSCPGGVVVISEQLCLMARPVGISMSGGVVHLPEREDQLEGCNAWMIHFMAGELGLLPAYAPQYRAYPFVCYVRGGRFDSRMRVVPIHRFSSRLEQFSGSEQFPADQKTTQY